MEYCDMGNLYIFQSQKNKKVFELNEAKKYMGNALDGLKHLHSNNVIHRDLKLENILLAHDPHSQETLAKICDFGFAKETEDEASTFCGTTYFMAPEIFAKKKYDAYVDVWSMGVILFYMLFGIYPFKSTPLLTQASTWQPKSKPSARTASTYNNSRARRTPPWARRTARCLAGCSSASSRSSPRSASACPSSAS